MQILEKVVCQCVRQVASVQLKAQEHNANDRCTQKFTSDFSLALCRDLTHRAIEDRLCGPPEPLPQHPIRILDPIGGPRRSRHVAGVSSLRVVVLVSIAPVNAQGTRLTQLGTSNRGVVDVLINHILLVVQVGRVLVGPRG